MQGGRDPFFGFGDPFGGFGGHRSLASSFFGGRDPFDDPFFNRPIGSMFGSSIFGPGRSPFESSFFGPMSPFMETRGHGFLEQQPSRPPRSTGPIIEELNSDNEQEEKADDKEEENPRKHRRLANEPFVEDPDDAAEQRRSLMQFRNEVNRADNTRSQPQSHNFTFQSSTVSYGGVNGVHYVSSTTRRSGSDGFTFEESKEANSATRQATHKIARGLHNKGQSVTRKLNSDGRVDTMQTLHNLNQDELAGFEQTWKGNAQKHLPGWADGMHGHGNVGSGSSVANHPNRGGWALPYVERSNQPRSSKPELASHLHSQNASRAKANVGSSSGFQAGPSDINNRDRIRRQ